MELSISGNMPNQYFSEDLNEIRVKTVFYGEVMITYIKRTIGLEQLCKEMRDICRFAADKQFTMKWVDEEGDPCTISTEIELNEAKRLYEINKDSELTIHGYFLFLSVLFLRFSFLGGIQELYNRARLQLKKFL